MVELKDRELENFKVLDIIPVSTIKIDCSSEEALKNSMKQYVAFLGFISVAKDVANKAKTAFEDTNWNWDGMTLEQQENVENAFIALNNFTVAFSQYSENDIKQKANNLKP